MSLARLISDDALDDAGHCPTQVPVDGWDFRLEFLQQHEVPHEFLQPGDQSVVQHVLHSAADHQHNHFAAVRLKVPPVDESRECRPSVGEGGIRLVLVAGKIGKSQV